MVQSVDIPLSWANNIPGVSGIEDVSFSVPELDDVVDVVVANTLDRTDIDETVTAAIEDATADLVDGIETSLPEVDFPEVEVFAQEFIEALTDLDGFFGPVEGDFRRALQDVLGDPELSIEGLDFDLTPITDRLDGLTATVDDIDVPSVADITDAAQSGAESALGDVLPEWVTGSLEDLAETLAGLIERRLVSDDVQQSLEDTLEGIE